MNINKNNCKKFYIETYGCQMNFADSEIVAAILIKSGYTLTNDIYSADIILLNTCAIRDNAEKRIWNRLQNLKFLKKEKKELTFAVLGCMAERLKTKLLEKEKLIDIVAGPDAYRDLPNLLIKAKDGRKAVNVLLSKEESYADINPVRLSSNGVSAFISIMRGCNNMCSFCVVPFTRGRERSRDPESIVNEAVELFNNGYREITLLGQNVDSYKFREKNGKVINFASLLEKVAQINPLLRIRFSTSHPKDMTDEVLYVMAKYNNICKYIHLPVQSGNNRILARMNRGYSREWYLDRINAIKTIVPNCAISTDIITGFSSETEKEHQDTLSLMEKVKYDFAYMFMYSERPKTLAARKYKDDIPYEVKKQRLKEIIDLQQKHSLHNNKKYIGKTCEVLIEGTSKRSKDYLYGRNSQNAVVVFPAKNFVKGEYVNVKITDCTSATLFGEVI